MKEKENRSQVTFDGLLAPTKRKPCLSCLFMKNGRCTHSMNRFEACVGYDKYQKKKENS